MAGCCNGSIQSQDETVRDQVRGDYDRVASGESARASEASEAGCCNGSSTTDRATLVADALGYDANDLGQLPKGANLGLSCGNPTAIAGLREGQIVLDLGSGASFDCFLVEPKVGGSGRVVASDMALWQP